MEGKQLEVVFGIHESIPLSGQIVIDISETLKFSLYLRFLCCYPDSDKIIEGA